MESSLPAPTPNPSPKQNADTSPPTPQPSTPLTTPPLPSTAIEGKNSPVIAPNTDTAKEFTQSFPTNAPTPKPMSNRTFDSVAAARTANATLSVHTENMDADRQLSLLPRVEFQGKTWPALGGIPLLAKLGQGGMGTVYYGLQLRLKKEVAIKVLPLKDSDTSSESVQRFFREAQIAANVQSPHLVSVLDVNEESGLCYLVMEFVHGQTAGQYLNAVRKAGAHGLSEEKALELLIAATRGLAAAHAEGILHRDVKPDNILIPRHRQNLKIGNASTAAATSQPPLTPPPTPVPQTLDHEMNLSAAKLSDLGLARPEESGFTVTLSSASMGTPGFISPEQALDAKSIRKTTDIFSMGATLYMLLSGRPPFSGATPMNAIIAAIQQPHEPLKSIIPTTSEAINVLINRCLCKAPEERYQDASALLEALEQCLMTVRQKVRRKTEFLDRRPTIKIVAEKTHLLLPAINMPIDQYSPVAVSAPAPAVPVVAKPAPIPAPAPVPTPASQATPKPLPAVVVKPASVPTPAPLGAPRPLSATQRVRNPHAGLELLKLTGTLSKPMMLERIVTTVIDCGGDLPAVSRFVCDVHAAVRNQNTSAQKISAMILKDVSLTARLLRTVNSALYRTSATSSSIISIPHAVLVLGVDTIAQLATCLNVFEQFGKADDVLELKRLTVQTLIGGGHSRELAQNIGVDSELAFIAGMMSQLGRLVMAFYLPAIHNHIEDTAARKHISASEACQLALGVNLQEIGQAVAKGWNLPNSICDNLLGLADGEQTNKTDRTQPLRAVIAFGRDLSEAAVMTNPKDRETYIQNIRNKYSEFIPVSEKRLEQILSTSSKGLQELTRSMGISNQELQHHAPGLLGGPHGPLLPQTAAQKITQSAYDQSMRDIAHTIGSKFSLNDAFLMILNAMKSSAALDHALLLLLSPSRDMLLGRIAVGPRHLELPSLFRLKIENSDSPLAHVISQSREIYLRQVRDTDGLPPEFSHMAHPAQILMSPIIVDNIAIGAFYAQRIAGQEVLTELEKSNLRNLRDQAVQAVKNTHNHTGEK